MIGLRPVAGNARVQLVALLLLFVALAWLLYMSSLTGQAEYEEAKARLDAVEVYNMRIDGALFPLMFAIRTDFDEIAELEWDLTDAVRRYEAFVEDDGSRQLIGMLDAKLEIVDEFKGLLAVGRNSAAIAPQTVAALITQAQPDVPDVLEAVDRAMIEFLLRRDPASAATLRRAVRDFPDDHPLASDPDWAVLEAHVRTMLQGADDMMALLGAMYSMPLPQAFLDQNAVLTERMIDAASLAKRYRIATLAVAMLLLGFAVLKVAEIRRYMSLLEGMNQDLERRVDGRTAELAKVNDSLRREMTERDEVEARLRVAERLESVGQLAAGVAHEINTPSQYVSDNISFADSAWQDVLPLIDDYQRGVQDGELDTQRARALLASVDVPYIREQVPVALRQAQNGIEQITAIVSAMEEFSRAGEEAFGGMDLNRAVNNAVTVMRSEWKYVADVELELAPDLPAVPADGAAINQVLHNLLVNAVQAVQAVPAGGRGGRGRILVQTVCTGDEVEIRIDDSGPGVDGSIRERIFDPFFTTREVGEGRGQGLAIAHRIVERQHGGRLAVETGRFGGARFVVSLPLRQPLKVAS